MTKKKVLSIMSALAGLAGIGYLIYEYNLLATVGKFVLRWLAQAWEFSLRLLEFLWRPLLVLLESIARSAVMRPFSKALMWLGAGYVLRYLLHPKVGLAYNAMIERFTSYGRIAGKYWVQIPLWVRVTLILSVSVILAFTHAQLLLLPLGFVLEPFVRSVFRWFAQQRLEKTSVWTRFKNELYRYTRIAMRTSALFRSSLGPLRALRLKGIRKSRVIHFARRRRELEKEL